MLLLWSLLTLKRRCKKHQVETPAKIKQEVGLYARDFGIASAIKKFITKYLKYSFIKTTVNTWKKKCNDGNYTVIKRTGRPNLLDSGMLKKVTSSWIWSNLGQIKPKTQE